MFLVRHDWKLFFFKLLSYQKIVSFFDANSVYYECLLLLRLCQFYVQLILLSKYCVLALLTSAMILTHYSQ